MVDVAEVSLGILAGGRGARVGGADKALLEYSGSTLLARTLAAFPEPFAERLLSYNRPWVDSSPVSGLRIVPDLRRGQPGPLAGLEALLHACPTPWLFTVPVDVRDWPPLLVASLIGWAGQGKDGVVLRDADGLQPLVGLWNATALRASASVALDGGEHAVHRWIATNRLSTYDISPQRLGNLNSPADFAAR
jgi:molybdopterin-guanine dinucleotide biosynthesis protein A